MNSSFSVGKQVAKSISLIKYIPEHQVYELNIIWETDALGPPSTLYLPEMFIYP